jgi:S-adenosylmethionine-dependent methyltransferase
MTAPAAPADPTPAAPDDPFAGKAEFFDRHYRESTRGRARLDLVLQRLVPTLPPPPATVLDAGGGTGAFAVPLARLGYRVTVLDRSAEWLEMAGRRALEAGVEVRRVVGEAAGAPGLLEERFDAVLCHTVLIYEPDPVRTLRALRAVAAPGAVLSSLEKNRDGLAMRPGLAGEHAEARRVLDDPMAAGRLGIVNRAYTAGELRGFLLRAGWRAESWAGVRLFGDAAPDGLEPAEYERLIDLEREAGRRDPYRRVSRLIHVLARAAPEEPEPLEEIQRRSFARASAATRRSYPPESALSGPELERFLRRKGYALLATARPDGTPHGAMVAFRARDGRLWFPSVAGAARLGNLDLEPRASVVVTEGEGEEHVAVLVEGEAVVHRDPGPILDGWLREAWRERFGTELDWAAAVIELHPAKVLSYRAERAAP